MKEIITITNPEDIQRYIEEKEGVKLELKKSNLNECKKDGHPPHYDTGTGNHMPWCKYSASTLKTQDFDGGDFHFLDSNNNIVQTITTNDHYGKTLIFSVDHKHTIDSHRNGNRVVDLLFWGAQ